ncbi:right-handed parallel beta-helix repeat-containing protein [Massilia pseudoviolaceinigra]|uniref:right-handed parallel beta-helix repeat-containing protein n=1 Tax=Massilia pseudoviolaceinigra TaxID=3057165 RepID=UPI00279673B2|nr:right-handed parallel beta-helix repeat-containing protein [Massilia sp. CCM 9206]MDQ1924199.1 right-handed parallel beta-helix repeat-containing protein [Massilia sp. CCM 9206]
MNLSRPHHPLLLAACLACLGLSLTARGTPAPGTPAAAAPAPASYHYYVASNGSDANPGTSAQPFETIPRASRVALPGTTVHVAPGTYAGGFRTTMSGTAERRISYVSTVRGGARLVPPRGSTTKMAWENRGDFVDIVGFQVDGRHGHGGVRWTYGIYNAGSGALIRNNHVHHVGQDVPCTSASAAGISIDSYYKGRVGTVTGNTVHDIGPTDCRFVQGINMSTTGSVTNNVLYAIGGAAIQMWHDATNVVVSHNTIARSMTGILVGGGDPYYIKGPNDFTTVHNNIVYDNKYGISEQGSTGLHNSYRNNLVYLNAAADWQLKNGLKHSGTVAQAPQFVRYGKGGLPDFRLRPSSPGVGKGSGEPALPADIAGKARARESGIDIGAYQR